MLSNMRSDPKSAAQASPADLDDRAAASPAGELEEDDESDQHSPDTARPDYDTDKFALHVESAKERMTSPPEAMFEMLRDSCKGLAAAEVPLDEEQILRPSSRKHKLPPRTE